MLKKYNNSFEDIVNIFSEHLIALVFVHFSQEGVVHQIAGGRSLGGVFLQALPDEILGLLRGLYLLRKLDFFVHNFGKIKLRVYLKRDSPVEQLIGQNSDTPHVYFVVVALLLENLR